MSLNKLKLAGSFEQLRTNVVLIQVSTLANLWSRICKTEYCDELKTAPLNVEVVAVASMLS